MSKFDNYLQLFNGFFVTSDHLISRIIIDFLSLEDLNEYDPDENAGSGDEDEDN